ncbi:MAG: 50S ribosomal protein L23 [Spirochaetae bacterium HGW-Spirochaetae-5]|jgi:large subunit ribosomal protein L23|nr:MAG: 50S ribosomal protein L23 [Spirochaetae bacterium HGW-Spirochaetae-5]
MNSNDIIIRPIISEKTTELMEQHKYVFQVARDANKLTVKKALKDLFNVTPEKVNILNVRGKNRRLRFRVGKRAAWKKAIVTLSAGDKIEIFEGQ